MDLALMMSKIMNFFLHLNVSTMKAIVLEFKDNWDLSVIRATSVVRILIKISMKNV